MQTRWPGVPYIYDPIREPVFCEIGISLFEKLAIMGATGRSEWGNEKERTRDVDQSCVYLVRSHEVLPSSSQF